MTTGIASSPSAGLVNENEEKTFIFGVPLVDLPRYTSAPPIGDRVVEQATFVNFPLLDEIMAYIEAHPMEWKQDDWFKIVDKVTGESRYETQEVIVTEINSCGASMCFAGHVALRMGFPAPPKSNHEQWTREMTDPQDGYPYLETVSDFAQNVLGLEYHQAEALFAGDNSLEMLRDIVTALHINPDLHGEDLEAVAQRCRDEYPTVKEYLAAE